MTKINVKGNEEITTKQKKLILGCCEMRARLLIDMLVANEDRKSYLRQMNPRKVFNMKRAKAAFPLVLLIPPFFHPS